MEIKSVVKDLLNEDKKELNGFFQINDKSANNTYLNLSRYIQTLDNIPKPVKKHLKHFCWRNGSSVEQIIRFFEMYQSIYTNHFFKHDFKNKLN